MRAILRLFFRLLYHPFAFAYDFVAAIVSFGMWKDWILEVVPFIAGTRILEIGHGPGHLHRLLLDRGLMAVAIDESAQMGRLAYRNLSAFRRESVAMSTHTLQYGYAQVNLSRGLAQALPFRNDAFDTVLATFPAEYIADPLTLFEVRRCLSDGGRFVVLPAALPRNWFLSWLFKVTRQAPIDALQVVEERLKESFTEGEFNVDIHVLERKSVTLIIIVASKSPPR